MHFVLERYIHILGYHSLASGLQRLFTLCVSYEWLFSIGFHDRFAMIFDFQFLLSTCQDFLGNETRLVKQEEKGLAYELLSFDF